MLKFAELWKNHPLISGTAPLLDERVYVDQCAIEVYAALQLSGANFRTFRGAMSWQRDKPKYAIRAQDLADWLSDYGSVSSRREVYSGDEAFAKIMGRSGILFIQHYWGFDHRGNHIDLFDGSKMTGRLSWARIHLGFLWKDISKDYSNARQMWFWPVP